MHPVIEVGFFKKTRLGIKRTVNTDILTGRQRFEVILRLNYVGVLAGACQHLVGNGMIRRQKEGNPNSISQQYRLIRLSSTFLAFSSNLSNLSKE